MKVNVNYIVSFLVLIVLMILPLTHCFLGSPDYTLTVFVGEGINGTPESGTYVYPEFTEVTFNYAYQEGKNAPQVHINGARAEVPFGTIVMFNNIELRVEQIDVRGEWRIVMREEETDIFDIVFKLSGADIYSGTFTDDRNFTGTWTIDGNKLTITFDNWADYKLEGYANSMNGTWTGEGKAGVWEGEKIQ